MKRDLYGRIRAAALGERSMNIFPPGHRLNNPGELIADILCAFAGLWALYTLVAWLAREVARVL